MENYTEFITKWRAEHPLTDEEIEQLKIKLEALKEKQKNKSPNTYQVMVSYDVEFDLNYQPTEEQLRQEAVKALLSVSKEEIVENGDFAGDFSKCVDWDDN